MFIAFFFTMNNQEDHIHPNATQQASDQNYNDQTPDPLWELLAQRQEPQLNKDLQAQIMAKIAQLPQQNAKQERSKGKRPWLINPAFLLPSSLTAAAALLLFFAKKHHENSPATANPPIAATSSSAKTPPPTNHANTSTSSSTNTASTAAMEDFFVAEQLLAAVDSEAALDQEEYYLWLIE